MKKRLLLILLLVVFMTGCNVNYTIEITADNITESLDISEKDMEKARLEDEAGNSFKSVAQRYGTERDILTSFEMGLTETGCETDCKYYAKEYVDNDEEVALVLSTTHTYEEFADSAIANEYLPNFQVVQDGDLLTITGGGDWTYLNDIETFDELTITVKTEFKVEDTNATRDGNDKYIWTIKKGDKDSKLHITINKALKDEKIVEHEKSKNLIVIGLVILLFILIFLLIVYSLYQKKRDNNRL